MFSFIQCFVYATVLLISPDPVLAGFSGDSQQNIAIYWDTDIDIIPLAFMNGISPMIVNFASAGDKCDKFSDNPLLLRCPDIEQDINTCQKKYGKTIILSLGGATYTQGGWSNSSDAEIAARSVWDTFGPVPSDRNVSRPFGSAVVDGFDFDFESVTNNLPAFGAELRRLIDGTVDKKYYLTAAPQCVFPDAAVGPTLDTVGFDFVMVQFYNNWCGVSNFQLDSKTENAFNFDVWEKWAKGSKNPKVKVFLGIPANTGAGSGYTNGEKLKAVITYSKKFDSFGGVMMWDMSQLYASSSFLNEVVGDLA
ncbi:Chitinase 2 [Conoideocrella luteorostrata]|uniref:chitinase n=1 Tax=Conoideocrella luteorostrata TaxID=1105319 RepID=A0AAJ0CS35_9HYPO|nr:Chitinase 2 [Conoideocrella luteorostrata]